MTREHAELHPRARNVALVAWCSFLAAALATMFCFAWLDPQMLARGDTPAWWTTREKVYAVGFFFLWIATALASALTLYMARTDRRDRHG